MDQVLAPATPFRCHTECDKAAREYHDHIEAPEEGVLLYYDIRFKDAGWLWKHHPVVARRLNLPESRK